MLRFGQNLMNNINCGDNRRIITKLALEIKVNQREFEPTLTGCGTGAKRSSHN